MENNKTYLRHFGLIFLISALSFILLNVISGIKPEEYNRNRFFIIFLQSYPVLLFFINTGIATQKWKAAAGSMGIFILVLTSEYIFYSQKWDDHMSRILIFILQELLYIIPFFVFFLFVKTDRKKLPFIFLGLLLMIGMAGAYQSEKSMEWLSRLFSINLHISRYIFSFVVSVTEQIMIVVLMCELLNYAQGKSKGFQTRLINPGNEYNKLNASVIYWSFKSFLYVSILGCLGKTITYIDVFNNHDKYILSFVKWPYLITLLFTPFFLFALAWYLRKFLLEFFISYNFTSRFLYWFLLLPGLGFLAWLVILTDSNKQTAFKQRQQSIEKFSADSSFSIVVVFTVLIILQFILSIAAEQWQVIFPLIVTAVFFAMMVISRTGYYFNLWFNFVVLAIFTIFLVIGTKKDITPLFYPLVLLNTVQLILIMPAFHFGAFNYISYENDENLRQQDQDLF
jgi:hypothetical protein